MPKLSPQQIAAKAAARASAASQDYRDGVNRVQTAPGQRAAAKKEKYRAGVNESVDRWAQRTAAVSLADWQRVTAEKGGARYASGVAAAGPKIESFWQDFGPALDAAKTKVDAMPSDTYEQRKAKSAAMQDALHAYKRRT